MESLTSNHEMELSQIRSQVEQERRRVCPTFYMSTTQVLDTIITTQV